MPQSCSRLIPSSYACVELLESKTLLSGNAPDSVAGKNIHAIIPGEIDFFYLFAGDYTIAVSGTGDSFTATSHDLATPKVFTGPFRYSKTSDNLGVANLTFSESKEVFSLELNFNSTLGGGYSLNEIGENESGGIDSQDGSFFFDDMSTPNAPASLAGTKLVNTIGDDSNDERSVIEGAGYETNFVDATNYKVTSLNLLALPDSAGSYFYSKTGATTATITLDHGSVNERRVLLTYFTDRCAKIFT